MRKAFTLIELLVVISIIALLIAILLPALSKARQTAKQAACLMNLNQIAIATNAYVVDHDGMTPPGAENNWGGPWDRGFSTREWSGVMWSRRWWTSPRYTDRQGFGHYRRLGPLFSRGYANDPLYAYCPEQTESQAWKVPGGEFPGGAANRGFLYPQELVGDTTTQVMYGSYMYRDSWRPGGYEPGTNYTNLGWQMNQTILPDRDPGDLVLSSDVFSMPAERDNGHKPGYNFVRIDGSGAFYNDSDNAIRNRNGGNQYGSYYNTNRASLYIEQGYETFRYGELVTGTDLQKP
ncbi:MAG: prepilin-type N-terminal cleavage/methylation domain-containing protein [Phycisphaeraceae bacterium]